MPINTRARPRLRYKPKPNPKFRGNAVKIGERRRALAGAHKRTQF